MKILFTIGGEDHPIDRDERLDKILFIDAAAIQVQRLKEDEAKQIADPAYEIRPVFTAGDYAESLVAAIFDGLIKQQDDQRKAANAAEFDKADEKSKVLLVKVNEKLVAALIGGDTAKVQQVATALGVTL